MAARRIIRTLAPLSVAVAIIPFACEPRARPHEAIAKPADSTPPSVSSEPSVDTSPSGRAKALGKALEWAKICDDGAQVPRPKSLPIGGLSLPGAASTKSGTPHLRAEVMSVLFANVAVDELVGGMCRSFDEWKACFTTADTSSTPLAGSVTLMAIVGADGRIVDVPTCSGSIDIPAVSACLVAVARRRSFRPPTPGDREIVLYAFSYDHK
jgi:hypothetical protein